ncbi:MAG TPA: hypothetical protein VGN86_11705, partial [Pyrinomonadaceae bacterium]|nr:hypothetical protein [Pyrinomonadaceae bacterium]
MIGHFESRKDKLASMPVFLLRILKSLLMAFCLIAVALLIGILGYHWLAGFEWIDSLLEASMILGGMGPIKELHAPGAKVFASIYAL